MYRLLNKMNNNVCLTAILRGKIEEEHSSEVILS
jgi:hypothetical protein